LGGAALKSSSVFNCILAGIAIICAVLSHTLTIALFPVLVAAIVIGHLVEGKHIPVKLYYVAGTIATVLALIMVFYIIPLSRGWNQGENWGYSVPHAIMATINQLGWPIALLTIIGAIFSLDRPTALNWYWLTCLVGLARLMHQAGEIA
jgi:hypothetical protein